MALPLITLDNLIAAPAVEKITIHALDLSLYQASAWIAGKEYFVTDNKGKLLRSFRRHAFQEEFRSVNFDQMVLRQESPYDEMVGHPPRAGGDNAMELPISLGEVVQFTPR